VAVIVSLLLPQPTVPTITEVATIAAIAFLFIKILSQYTKTKKEASIYYLLIK
jgi:hypothetical protein